MPTTSVPRAQTTRPLTTRCTTTAGPNLSPRERALCDFAVKLTTLAAEVDEADIDALRAEGLTDADVSDAIQVIAYFNYVTRVADGVGIEDEPEWRRTRRRLRDGHRRRLGEVRRRPGAPITKTACS